MISPHSLMILIEDETGGFIELEPVELASVNATLQEAILIATETKTRIDLDAVGATILDRLRDEHDWDDAVEFSALFVPMSCMTPFMFDVALAPKEVDEEAEAEDEDDTVEDGDVDPFIEFVYTGVPKMFEMKRPILPVRLVISREMLCTLIDSAAPGDLRSQLRRLSADAAIPEESAAPLVDEVLAQIKKGFATLYVEVNGEPVITITVED